MPKYLSLGQYKRISDGISLTNVSDMKLANMVNRAETLIDAHMGFDAKRGGFEPHDITVQHPFKQETLKSFDPQPPVPMRVITRYRIQVSNLSTTGAGFFANISPNDCVINNDGQYVEIVPLQAVTYSLSPILIQLGLKPPIVEMDCTLGYYLPVWGDILIDNGDHLTYYGIEGFWASTYTLALHLQPATLPAIPAVIYVNGVVQTSGYTVNYAEGSVVFNSARSSTDVVTADYTKTIPPQVREATVIQTSWQLAQANLNQLGMLGLEAARTGDQDIRRPRTYASTGGLDPYSALCEAAITSLKSLVPIAIC